MTRDVHVVAISARTPVGLTAASAAAAVRAGISRIREHPIMTCRNGEPVRAAFDAVIPPKLQGVQRLLALTSEPLRAILSAIPELSVADGLPLTLSVPEHRPGFTKQDEAKLVREVTRAAERPIRCVVIERGHAGALHAVGESAGYIASGRGEICIVGGVESYFDAATIEWLAENEQLASAETRSPFCPGEGAGFVVLMSQAMRRQCKLPSLAILRGFHSARETALIKTDAINLGRAMTEAVRQATTSLARARGDQAVDESYCDLNGERYRTDEWQYVVLRLPEVFRYAPLQPSTYVTACDSWGDMGAATGTLLTTLAVRAWARGCDRGQRALIAAGSEGGLRSAIVLEQGVDAREV